MRGKDAPGGKLPAARRTWRDVLRYDPRADRATVRRYYKQYRKEHGLPERCDVVECRFHTEALAWNGKPFRPILDHANGVNGDNRPGNLRYLCPNCDAQQETRGGANKGRVDQQSGGFSVIRRDGSGLRAYTLPAETGIFRVTGMPSRAEGVSSRPFGSEDRGPPAKRDSEGGGGG